MAFASSTGKSKLNSFIYICVLELFLLHSPEMAEEYASKMVDQLLITKQTGAAGRICKKVMVAERKFPRREFYFAVMMERAFNVSAMIV